MDSKALQLQQPVIKASTLGTTLIEEWNRFRTYKESFSLSDHNGILFHFAECKKRMLQRRSSIQYYWLFIQIREFDKAALTKIPYQYCLLYNTPRKHSRFIWKCRAQQNDSSTHFSSLFPIFVYAIINNIELSNVFVWSSFVCVRFVSNASNASNNLGTSLNIRCICHLCVKIRSCA